MDITITPGKLNGVVSAIASKSQAHRLLICSAFAKQDTTLICRETNQDITATVNCLNALGADIQRTEYGYFVSPVKVIPESAVLDCCESGSTLRFMLPIVGALGVDSTIHMSGRLPNRPLSPLWEEMERMGCKLTRPTLNTIRCHGKLRSGSYTIDGSVSSQFITGLLFATALLDGESQLTITKKLESEPYVRITQLALSIFGVSTNDYVVVGSYPFSSPGNLTVEGDWSNAAFFLTAQALGNPVETTNLNTKSPQGDRAIVDLLTQLKTYTVVSAADIPDLVPVLAVYAAANQGAVFTDVYRLRLKESDRIASVVAMLTALGIRAESTTDTLTVHSGIFHGGTVDSANDHRIAMSAAIAATIADGPVTILNADCVAKSYPTFWLEYRRLGGNYEQHIR